MPTYKLEFLPSALKEWRKLGATVRNQFAKKLAERLAEPRVPSARLSEFPDCYKIKLRKAGVTGWSTASMTTESWLS